MKIRHLRWGVAGLLAAATALSYLDRQSFPLVVNEVAKEIPISNEAYTRLTTLFLVAYGAMYAGGGWLLDRSGGLHPFGTGGDAPPPASVGGPYWPGVALARGVAALP